MNLCVSIKQIKCFWVKFLLQKLLQKFQKDLKNINIKFSILPLLQYVYPPCLWWRCDSTWQNIRSSMMRLWDQPYWNPNALQIICVLYHFFCYTNNMPNQCYIDYLLIRVTHSYVPKYCYIKTYSYTVVLCTMWYIVWYLT